MRTAECKSNIYQPSPVDRVAAPLLIYLEWAAAEVIKNSGLASRTGRPKKIRGNGGLYEAKIQGVAGWPAQRSALSMED